MSKNLKTIYNDIINNRNLEDNIPEFFDVTMDKYNSYAVVRLALHYYTYYEMYWDDKDIWGSQLLELTKKVNTIILDTLFQSKEIVDLDDYIKQIDSIRTCITERVEMLTSCVDMHDSYEYALKRVRYRFEDMEPMGEDEEFAREVLRFIFDSDDNVLVNGNIKDTVSILPVRITKHKFFSYINDSLHGLLGAQEDVLEYHMYLIRSCAMLDIKEDLKEAYPNLWEIKKKIESLDFKNITKTEYQEVALLTDWLYKFLQSEYTAYNSLVEIVNELYTMLICSPYTGASFSIDKKREEAALYIIKNINNIFIEDKTEEPVQEILDRFKTIEGFQEEIEYDLIRLEDLIYHVNEHHKSLVINMGKDKQLDTLLISKNLMSGSLYIELDRVKSDGIVDKKRLRHEIDELINELTDKFLNVDRMIVRAIMARTMEKLPVAFNTHTEVMDYILYSLNKCTDMAEKYASRKSMEHTMEFWYMHQKPF